LNKKCPSTLPGISWVVIKILPASISGPEGIYVSAVGYDEATIHEYKAPEKRRSSH